MLKKIMFMQPPKKGEITISQTTKDSLEECLSHLKNATAFAARNDSPEVTHQITEVLMRVDSILRYDEMMNAVEEFSEKLQRELGDNY
jgi:hypothetical protein